MAASSVPRWPPATACRRTMRFRRMRRPSPSLRQSRAPHRRHRPAGAGPAGCATPAAAGVRQGTAGLHRARPQEIRGALLAQRHQPAAHRRGADRSRAGKQPALRSHRRRSGQARDAASRNRDRPRGAAAPLPADSAEHPGAGIRRPLPPRQRRGRRLLRFSGACQRPPGPRHRRHLRQGNSGGAVDGEPAGFGARPIALRGERHRRPHDQRQPPGLRCFAGKPLRHVFLRAVRPGDPPHGLHQRRPQSAHAAARRKR